MFWLKFKPSSDRNIEKTQLQNQLCGEITSAGKSLVNTSIAHIRLVDRAERTFGNSPRLSDEKIKKI